jgi:DNA-directed RNA polymerase subunit K/omega
MDEIEDINESDNESDEESITDEIEDNDIEEDKNIVLNDSIQDEDQDDDEDVDEDEDVKLLEASSIDHIKKYQISQELETSNPDIKDKYQYSIYNYKENENTIENNLIKFDEEIRENYLIDLHPECISKNFEEIKVLSKIIIDEFHKTLPILTKYEKTKIIGIRTKQLNNGSAPYISVDEKIIDNYIIAKIEVEQKKLPFIISRPLPNRNFEYWKLQDLEIL